MPKSITIHGLDDRISRRIEAKAKAEGRSLNRTVKILIEAAIEMPMSGSASTAIYSGENPARKPSSSSKSPGLASPNC